MASIIDAIKAKVDVVEEIGLVVPLQKAGKSFRGLCPFHNERTPSFHVFAESQTWHCFGCNEGGDIFTFVQKQQGIDFREALLYLAEKAGVAIEVTGGRSAEEEREANAAKERLCKLNEDAALWFHQVLLRSKEAVEARAYIQSRGISPESVLAFSLGYAPERGDGLCRYLLDQGYTEQELVSGGLAREREEGKGGGVYDYFRHRLIFPIRDMRGRVIGFGGRAIGEEQPKYLNSPQTPLFEKNSVLYALDMARDAIKQARQVVIVEGYVDAIIAHQYGTKQTVACIGSAITEKHIQQLKKLTKQVTLALDPDAAGQSATEHGIQEALKTFDRALVPVPLSATPRGQRARDPLNAKGFIKLEEQLDAEINVLRLPAGEDPDEVIRKNFALWEYAVAHPIPLIDYYFEVKTADLNLSQPGHKTEAAKRLLPIIGWIPDRIKREEYARKLAAKIRVDETSLLLELQSILKAQKPGGIAAAFTEPGRKGQASLVSNYAHTAGGNGEAPPGEAQDTGREEPGEGQRQQRSGSLDRKRWNKVQWEDYLIGLLLQNPGLNPQVCGIINDGDFTGADTRELYHILNSIYQRGSSSLREPLEQLVPPVLLATIERARKSVELGSPKDGAGLAKEAIQCATRLKRLQLLQLNTELQYVLREAEQAGDALAAQQLKRRLMEYQIQLRTIYKGTPLQG